MVSSSSPHLWKGEKVGRSTFFSNSGSHAVGGVDLFPCEMRRVSCARSGYVGISCASVGEGSEERFGITSLLTIRYNEFAGIPTPLSLELKQPALSGSVLRELLEEVCGSREAALAIVKLARSDAGLLRFAPEDYFGPRGVLGFMQQFLCQRLSLPFPPRMSAEVLAAWREKFKLLRSLLGDAPEGAQVLHGPWLDNCQQAFEAKWRVSL